MLWKDQKLGEAYDRAYRQTTWPTVAVTWSSKETPQTSLGAHKPSKTVMGISLRYKSLCWGFDGGFQTSEEDQNVSHSADNDSPFPISDLNIFPLRFAPDNAKERLLERGRKFWNCRHKQYVAYKGLDYGRREYFVSICL